MDEEESEVDVVEGAAEGGHLSISLMIISLEFPKVPCLLTAL